MNKILTKLTLLALMGAALTGCGAVERIENIGKPPALAPVGSPAEREIVARIPRAQPITHANNSLWQAGAKSFFRDPRASNVGDIITVNISVADTANLSNSTARSRANSDKANLSNFFGLETVLPTGIDPTSLVNMGSDTSNNGSGSITRSESINLTLAALVAQVLPNGNFVIDGHQQVRVNNELRDLKVTGIVRAEDITQNNTVNLAQIAEARISYGGQGTVSDVQQPRYGSQLYDIIMPF
jgi:flagellar L-ring protein precursor FlgH